MIALLIFTSLLLTAISAQDDNTLLIDAFSKDDGVSNLGTRWRSFADTVMGGVSSGRMQFTMIDNERCLRLTGTVSLENNGGFIQAALSLSQRGSLNAGKYEGIRIRVRGNGEKYYIHLRTGQTRLPWMYFYAPFNTSSEWQTIDIPFSDFILENGRGRLNTIDITRIAIVAAKKAFEADVAVSRIELYRINKGTLVASR